MTTYRLYAKMCKF